MKILMIASLILVSSCALMRMPSTDRTDNMIPSFLKEVDESNLKNALTVLKDNAAKGGSGHYSDFSIKYRGKENRFSIHDYKHFVRIFSTINKCSSNNKSRDCFMSSYKNKKGSVGKSEHNAKKVLAQICKDHCYGSDYSAGICMVLNSPIGRKWTPGESFLKNTCSSNDKKSSW